jgi:uncharacterized protein (TIGR02996 family)
VSDEAAFLAAIRAEPDDDTVRLVYADWLDEHGDAARAKFIRVQCERERLVAETESGAYRCAHVRLVAETESGAYRCAHVGVTADVLVADLMPPDARRYLALDPRSEAARTVALVVRADAPGVMPMLTRWDGVEVTRFDLAPDGLRLTGRAGDHGRWVEGFRELVRRERELLKAGHADWCRLPIVFVPRLSEEPLQQYNARYRRGFLADICCAAHDWLAHAEAIRAVHPVTRVTLTTFPPHAWQMANLPPNWPLHAHRFLADRRAAPSRTRRPRTPLSWRHVRPQPGRLPRGRRATNRVAGWRRPRPAVSPSTSCAGDWDCRPSATDRSLPRPHRTDRV